MVRREFWRDRSVFVTGDTGFKGGRLATWLVELGARVVGDGLTPDTTSSYFARCAPAERVTSHVANVTDAAALERALTGARPSVVFHLAAQSLVCGGYAQPARTFATNVLGTAHVLEAVRRAPSVSAARRGPAVAR